MKDIILCKEIVSTPEILKNIGIKESEQGPILNEARMITVEMK